MQARHLIGTLVAPFFLYWWAAPKAGDLSEADRAAIESGRAAFEKGANAEDFDTVAALYTQDAVLLPPNAESVRGSASIRAFFEGYPEFSDFELETVETEGRGDLAYVRGTYSMKVSLPGADEAVEDRGKYLEIWRKQADGSWKISRDIFNSDIPLPE